MGFGKGADEARLQRGDVFWCGDPRAALTPPWAGMRRAVGPGKYLRELGGGERCSRQKLVSPAESNRVERIPSERAREKPPERASQFGSFKPVARRSRLQSRALGNRRA